MTESELEARLRRTLHAKAAEVHAPSDGWSRDRAGNVTPLRRGVDRRLLVGVPAAVIGIAAALAVAVAVNRPAGRAHQVAAPTFGRADSAAAPANPSAAPLAAGPATAAAPAAGASSGALSRPGGGPVPAGFEPVSVTFVSALEGWVLGTAPCSAPPCTSVLRTADGGRTWAGVPAPRAALSNGSAGGVAHIRFADARNGWAYGGTPAGSVLYATHDGGSSWNAVVLPVAGELSALESSAGSVHAVVIGNAGSVRIATSPAGADSWSVSPVTIPVGAGPVPHAQLVLQGATGWVVEVNRTVVGGARLVNGAWTSWQPPCAQVQGPAVLAASSPVELTAACQIGLWSQPQGEHLFVSHDGGAGFTQASGPPAPTGGSQVIASPRASQAVLGTVATDGAASLVATFDGGRSWVTVYRAEPGVASIDELGFTTGTDGVAVVGDPGQRSLLLKTVDGGHQWTPVTFGS